MHTNPITAWANTVSAENREDHPYSSPCCLNWETLIQTEHCTLCCIQTVGSEKETHSSFWCWISFFLPWVSQRTDCGLREKKKIKPSANKQRPVDGCGIIHEAARLVSTPFSHCKAVMDNSCCPGGLLFGSCPLKATSKASSHLAQSFLCCFLSEKTD